MSDVHTFEAHRDRMMGIAYRMLGSVSEAEDAVQECWLRWSRVDEVVRSPSAYLNTIVIRLCLDRLKSAQARRETYVGPWLPEPWITAEPPEDPVMASSLSIAFMRLLETLTGPQRAALLLRDVFEHEYDEIAQMLDTSPANARQLARRARSRVQDAPRFTVDPQRHSAMLVAFGVAAAQGDVSAIATLLTEDAVGWSDGGGKVTAARVPVHGGAKLAKMYAHFAAQTPEGASFEPAWVNGMPGIVTRIAGRVVFVHVLGFQAERIAAIYAMLNPDKLGHLNGGEDT